MATYKLYSVQRMQRSKILDTPRLIADCGNVTSVGDLKWADNRTNLESLEPMKSTVMGDWRITRLPDYQSGAIMYDSQAKEFVKISNGSCVLSHFDGTTRFQEEHPNNAPCVFAPSEAIALRPMVQRDGTCLVGWTYRAVDPCRLESLTPSQQREQAVLFSIALTPLDKDAKKQFVGRI